MAAPPTEVKQFTGDQDTRRWIALFKRQQRSTNANNDHAQWLEDFDIMMDGKAADWFDAALKQLLDVPTQESLDKVTTDFLKKWQTKSSTDPTAAIEQIMNLAQGEDESLKDYSDRANILLRMAGVTDSTDNIGPGSGVLNIAIACFRKGLRNRSLRALVLNEAAPATLQSTVARIEASHRQMEANERLQREEQTQQERELLFEYTTLTRQGRPIPPDLELRIASITNTGVKKSSMKTVAYAESSEIPQQQQQQQPQYRSPTPAPLPRLQSLWYNQQQQTPPRQTSPWHQQQQSYQTPRTPSAPQQFRQQPMSRQGSFQGNQSRQDPSTGQPLPQFYHEALRMTKEKYPECDPTTSSIPIINSSLIYRHSSNPLCCACD
ncbi:hypothetical protein TI39_contig494g00003 [Zymoseptoria brevis]|uniref:Retrotransposon gag domain-containing protein n=1 Tax=Zymoseptoria brevis TaxID=1047168 RepID=A0A0F4GJ71_9PEZI|nr:hypothetical protein TI39_contig494g00003 [Zymoseptoria brevis]